MTMLPRTRRGVWLTAAAVWLAGCAGLWWLLPPVPRAERCFGPSGGSTEILPGGPTFVVSSNRGWATGESLVWNAATGDVTPAPGPAWLASRKARYSPDGRWRTVANLDPFAVVHDLVADTSRRIPLADNRLSEGYLYAEFSPDSRTLAITDILGTTPVVKLYSLPTVGPPRVFQRAMWPFRFSADSRRIACAVEPNTSPNRRADIGIWSVEDGSRLGTVTGSIIRVIDVMPDAARAIEEINPGGCFAIPTRAGSNCARYECIDREGLAIWSTEQGFAGRLMDGGRRLILAHEGDGKKPGRVVVRDTADGRVVRTYDLSPDADVVAAFSPDGRTAAVVGNVRGLPGLVNGWLRRWGVTWSIPWADSMLWTVDLPTGRASAYLSPEPSFVEFSADGQSLCTVDTGSTCRVWDLPPRKPLGWYAAGATLCTVPLALVARWRIRRIASRAAA